MGRGSAAVWCQGSGKGVGAIKLGRHAKVVYAEQIKSGQEGDIPVSYTHLMQYIKCDVSTICIGMAASMGAFLMAAGQKGKRKALPNSEIMIHQPLGGTQGQATDIAIHAQRIIAIKDKMNKILSERTGQTLKKVQKDVERDYFMTSEEALEYGIIDEIIPAK